MTVKKTSPTCPLLVSLAEASFQLSLPESDILELVRAGELTAIGVRGQTLIPFDSLVSFTRRARRNLFVLQEVRGSERA